MVFDKHGGLATCKESVAKWNASCGPLTRNASAVAPTSAPSPHAPRSSPPRTGCFPVFQETEEPINVAQTYTFPEECVQPVARVEADNELLGFCCIVPSEVARGD